MKVTIFHSPQLKSHCHFRQCLTRMLQTGNSICCLRAPSSGQKYYCCFLNSGLFGKASMCVKHVNAKLRAQIIIIFFFFNISGAGFDKLQITVINRTSESQLSVLFNLNLLIKLMELIQPHYKDSNCLQIYFMLKKLD